MSGRIVWSPKKRIRLNDGGAGNAYKENHMASPSQSNSITNRRESSEFDAELNAFLPPVSFQTAIIPVIDPLDEQLMLSIDLDGPPSHQPRSHHSLSTQEGEFDELAGLDVGELLNDDLRLAQPPRGISTRLRVVRVPLDGVPGGVGMEVVEIESNKTRYITLTQGWLNMYSQNPILPGDLVHLYVPAPETWQYDHYLLSDVVATYPPPLLAVHPQFVFTGTAVSSTVGCNRKSFLLWLLTPPSG
jgi:DNA replication factor Dna2